MYLASMCTTESKKIILLQLRKFRSRFICIINSDLLQKGSSGCAENVEYLKQQIQESIRKTGWNFVPRAKLVVNVDFSANNANVPRLPKLVKYLLDVLCGIIYRDDRQIEFLSACCFRPTESDSNSSHKDSIFIKVERLIDFKQKFRLYLSLKDEVKDELEYSYQSLGFFDGSDSNIKKLWPDEETARFLNLPKDAVEALHKQARMENQQRLLAINRIDDFDWSDGLKSPFYKIYSGWWEFNPLIFEMNGLPTSGGKNKYRSRLKNKLAKLNEKFPSFGKIVAPLELDVQFRPKGNKLDKDLDNIMLDLSSTFQEALLEEGSYLHGYRIYITKSGHLVGKAGTLRFKLLPLFAISDFDNLMQKTLELGAQWLEDNI